MTDAGKLQALSEAASEGRWFVKRVNEVWTGDRPESALSLLTVGGEITPADAEFLCTSVNFVRLLLRTPQRVMLGLGQDPESMHLPENDWWAERWAEAEKLIADLPAAPSLSTQEAASNGE